MRSQAVAVVDGGRLRLETNRTTKCAVSSLQVLCKVQILIYPTHIYMYPTHIYTPHISALNTYIYTQHLTGKQAYQHDSYRTLGRIDKKSVYKNKLRGLSGRLYNPTFRFATVSRERSAWRNGSAPDF